MKRFFCFLLLIVLAAQLYGAPALVTHGTAQGDTTATTGSLNTTGSSFIVASVACYFFWTPALSDSKSNTWTLIRSDSVTPTVSVYIFYAQNPTVGSGHTFTSGGSGISGHGNMTLLVATFSGMKTSGVYAGTNNGNQLMSSSSIQPGSITPASGPQLVIATLGAAVVPGATSINQSFVTTDVDQGGVNYPAGLAYLVQANGTTINPTWTISATGAMCSNIAAFAGVPVLAGMVPSVY